LHSLFSGKDRDLKIQRQRVLYRGLTMITIFCFILLHNIRTTSRYVERFINKIKARFLDRLILKGGFLWLLI